MKDSNLTTVYTPSHGINFCPSSSVSMKNAYNLSLMFVFDVVPQKGQVPLSLTKKITYLKSHIITTK